MTWSQGVLSLTQASLIPAGRVWQEPGNQLVLPETILMVCVSERVGKEICPEPKASSQQPSISPLLRHSQKYQLLPGVLHQMALLISLSAQRQNERENGAEERKELPGSQLGTRVFTQIDPPSSLGRASFPRSLGRWRCQGLNSGPNPEWVPIKTGVFPPHRPHPPTQGMKKGFWSFKPETQLFCSIDKSHLLSFPV